MAAAPPIAAGRFKSIPLKPSTAIPVEPSNGGLGSIEWNISYTVGEESGVFGAGVAVWPDHAAGGATQAGSLENACSTRPERLSGFPKGTVAQVCRDYSSPAQWAVFATGVDGPVVWDVGTDLKDKAVAMGTAKATTAMAAAVGHAVRANLP